MQTVFGVKFHRTTADISLNPFNLQPEFLTWKNTPALCTTACQIVGDTESRLVIRFDKWSGKCECLINAENELFDISKTPKSRSVTYFYPSKHSNFYWQMTM